MPTVSNTTRLHFFPFSFHNEWIRHLLLIILMFIFSFAEMGGRYDTANHGLIPLTVMCIVGTICKLIPVYAIILFLVPRLLPQCRYVLFWPVTFTVVFLSVLLQRVAETAVYRCFELPFWWSQREASLGYFLDICVQSVHWFLVLMGLSVGYMLKYLTTETQRKQKMQTSRLQMESELMKEQVAPALLCKTLHQSGTIAQTDARKASELLILLSRLLRYQLYDCRRKEVFLDSEIKFLHDYLTLLKLNSESADYSLSIIGRTSGIFVPPLLFVSLIQQPIKGVILIELELSEDVLTFRVKGDCRCTDKQKVCKRLEQLYPQCYNLTLSPQNTVLSLQLRRL